MDIQKIFMIICCFILIVCLTLCISTLVVLRNAIAENSTVQSDAKDLVNVLDDCVADLNEAIQNESSVSASVNTEKETATTDYFCIREVNGKIGIYTSDGTLLKLLEVSVDSLPKADREKLSNGITVTSWRELLSLLQDYMD